MYFQNLKGNCASRYISLTIFKSKYDSQYFIYIYKLNKGHRLWNAFQMLRSDYLVNKLNFHLSAVVKEDLGSGNDVELASSDSPLWIISWSSEHLWIFKNCMKAFSPLCRKISAWILFFLFHLIRFKKFLEGFLPWGN